MTRIMISCVVLAITLGSCDQPIIVGAERTETWLPYLTGKRVAVLVNQTSQVAGTHLVDFLREKEVDVVKIFSPEHGFRGQVPDGEKINDTVDVETKLPVISLYGKHKKPSKSDLDDVDMVVFDVQDVGTRFYTYISTLHYAMEACAAYGKTLIVFDRPNPNGHYVDGPVLQPEHQSFVGMHPIPIVHGLAVGELAHMINGEGWLEGGMVCDLKVVAMKYYAHDKPYQLPIGPSPNLPTTHAVALYPSLCLLEGTTISVGRGTSFPFEWVGHPDLQDQPFQFTPVSIPHMSKYPPHENKMCYGVDLTGVAVKNELDLSYLITFYQQFPDKAQFFNDYFEKLAGTEELRRQIEQGFTAEQIKASWEDGLEAYHDIRDKYLLYP